MRPCAAKRSRRAGCFWEHEGNRAIAEGDWKLVSRWPFGWELYDLATDRFETRDLAASNPERVADMASRWKLWAANVGVETWPLVVPWVETAISTGIAVLGIVFMIARAARARRGGAPPRTPGPFSGKPPTSPRSPVPAPTPPIERPRSAAGDRPKPITPR